MVYLFASPMKHTDHISKAICETTMSAAIPVCIYKSKKSSKQCKHTTNAKLTVVIETWWTSYSVQEADMGSC